MKIKAVNPITQQWEYFDLFGGDKTVIALTYEANPIGELKHRRSDMSNLIKLPKTPHNNQMMGFADEITEAYTVPYKKNNCVVEMDGIKVFDEGSYFVLVEAGKTYYQIKIFSGIANFFTTIQNVKLRDLPEDFYDGKENYGIPRQGWSIKAAGESYLRDFHDGSSGGKLGIIPIMDWNVEDKPTGLFDGDENNLPQVSVNTLYPCVRLYNLLRSICGVQGYKFITDVAQDDMFTNAAVACVSGIPYPQNEDFWKSSFKQNKSSISVKSNGRDYYYPYYDSKINDNNGVCGEGFRIEQNQPYSLKYVVGVNGQYTFKIQVKGSNRYTYTRVVVLIYRGGTKVHAITTKYLWGNTPFIIDEVYTVDNATIGENIEIMIMSYDSGIVISDVDISIDPFIISKEDQFPSGDIGFALTKNLPDISQLELFKQFALMYGQMVYVDERRKVVYCYNWNTIYKNIEDGNVKDWSDKLDNRSRKKSFVFGEYGQKSIIKYKDYEYLDEKEQEQKITSEGSLFIPNTTLSETKELFEMKASAVKDVRRFGLNDVAKIPYRKALEPQSGNAPFVILYLNAEENPDGNNKFILKDNRGSQELSVSKYIYASFKQLQASELIEKYYIKLQSGILKHCKVFTEQFLLTPTDIMNFDHSVPVYLSKYDMHFYVNKINNYKGGLTEVELIAILPL